MQIIKIIISSLFLSLLTGVVYAEDLSANEEVNPSILQFYAVNAGYKDDLSAQNYDFIELRQSGSTPLSLAGYELIYFNSVGNEAGRLAFTESQYLSETSVVFGFAESPQYEIFADSVYTYTFSSSGLASTAGKLQLLWSGTVVEELCWGKLECANPNPKFATKQEDNFSLVRCVSDDCVSSYLQTQYYPMITESITTSEPDEEETSMCDGLIISEIYTYYQGSASEQFVEFYNTSHGSIDLTNCNLVYKSKSYPIGGQLQPASYLTFQNPDIVFTKNPTTYNLYALANASGDIFYEVVLPHGQKKNASYAIFHPNSEEEQ